MRYPVTNTGSRKDFEKDWYVATPFGVKRIGDSYWHEGGDINLKTGGDTDLNQELKAIAKGQIVYYHKNTHPKTGFGLHLVIKIDGPWGTRWVMYAHMSELGFNPSVKEVQEGEIIGRIGKSGTDVAHLHFSIWKIDPATVESGIDNIANTLEECNRYWEDPIAFINTWIETAPTPTPPPVSDQSIYDFGEGFGIIELQAARSKMHDMKREIENKNQKLKDGSTQLRVLANQFEN